MTRFWLFLLGERLAMRLRLYTPPHISPDNKVVYSYIYGIDDRNEVVLVHKADDREYKDAVRLLMSFQKTVDEEESSNGN